MTKTTHNVLLTSTVILSLTTAILILAKSGKSYSRKPTKKFNTIEGAITEYKTGLADIQNPLLFPKSIEDIQQLTAASGDLTTYSQLVALTWLSPIQGNLSYRGLTPWEGPPDNHFGFEVEMTKLGWYFMYGKTKTMRFTLMIFFLGLNAANPESPLYSIVGGYEDSNTNGWKTIPHNGANATYSCDKNQNVKFTYPVASEGIVTSNGVAVTFTRDSGTKEMVGSFSVTSTDTTIPRVDFTLTPTQKPNYNGLFGGCGDIGCFGTLGTLYWSYTNPICTISSKASPIETGGVGWFDHQNILGGIPRNVPDQILFSFMLGGDVMIMPRWLWLTAQITGGKQYMVRAQKFKLEDLPFQIGQKLSCVVNRYDNNGVEYGLEGTLEIKKVMKYTNPDMTGYVINFPTRYLITVKDDLSFYLTTNNTGRGDTVIMPSGNVNWEGPGTVTALDKTTIGTGFLEANQLIPYSVYHQTVVNTVNGASEIVKPLPVKRIISNLGTYMGIMVITLLLIFSTTVVMALVRIF